MKNPLHLLSGRRTKNPALAEAQFKAGMERAEKCKAEIDRILKEYNCEIVPSMHVTIHGNIPRADVLPIPSAIV